MTLFSNKIYTKSNFTNFLLLLVPLTFIIGNVAINLNIFLFILSTLIFYKKDIFKIDYHFLDKIIFIFFFYILINGIYNNYITWADQTRVEPYNLKTLEKTILFQRFLLLYLIVRFIVEKKIVNFRAFFISCSIFSVFVSLDIFYQFIFNEDIFGYPGNVRKFSGPFGEELIAGGYLQRFSIFTFLLFPFFFLKSKNKLSMCLTSILFLIALSSIIISGNRMPLILFIIMISLIFILNRNVRKYSILFFLITSIICLIFYNFNSNIKMNLDNGYGKIRTTFMILASDKYENKISDKTSPTMDFFKEFESFHGAWLLNKYVGGGIKSFRYNCHKGFKNTILRKNLDPLITKELLPEFKCNTHPHNYYLEVLTDLGLIGFIILSFIFLYILNIVFIKRPNLREDHIIMPFIFLFFIEIFPIKTSGSFFTTGNATFIFLIMAFTVALSNYKNKLRNNK